jgi:hypothetical protein
MFEYAGFSPGANIRLVCATYSITLSAVAPDHPAPIVSASAFPIPSTRLKSVLYASRVMPLVWLASMRNVMSFPPFSQSRSGTLNCGSKRRTGVSKEISRLEAEERLVDFARFWAKIAE